MDDDRYIPLMQRACELATRGEGQVEPNPMVGCVIAQEEGNGWRIVGEGWHERFGGPHAEINALAAAGKQAQGATLFVTLEPCCHTGKTPPCADAVIAAGVRRVVIGHPDPFPQVAGGGIAALEAAGIECVVSSSGEEAARLLAPYLMLTEQKRPWVIAKWAMTLDGKIATSTGDSRWISGEASRAVVHQIRGRVDAVIVGAGTLVADDALLTARPPGPRTPMRIVVAGDRPLPLEAKLFASLDQGPVLLCTGKNYPAENAKALAERGVEIFCTDDGTVEGVRGLLTELGTRQLTNILVEGGSRLLGELFDAKLVDEAHVFIAPKLIGGADAPSPIAGNGFSKMANALELIDPQSEQLGNDLHLWGHVRREN